MTDVKPDGAVLLGQLSVHSKATDRDYLDLARRVIIFRRARVDYLPHELLGEPALDMLLDLFVASYEEKLISVSSACIASGAPPTTALRWLARLEELDLVKRSGDRNDRRRVYVEITPKAQKAIESWLRHKLEL